MTPEPGWYARMRAGTPNRSSAGPHDWHGFGWRIWRVETVPEAPDEPRLRNPWENSGLTWWWEPGVVQVADCFARLGVRGFGSRCSGYVSEGCYCGIRSIDTLSNLAAFLASDRQVIRYPRKAAAVGRVRIGGRVQHKNRHLPRVAGYQRSEFAQLVGPVFVSPLGGAGRRAEALARDYSSVRVVGPDLLVGARNQQEWIERLADHMDKTLSISGADQPVERLAERTGLGIWRGLGTERTTP